MMIRQTTPAETRRTDELFCIAFELPMEGDPDREPREEPGVHRWAAFEDGTAEMMSMFVLSDFPMNFDGHSCLMGGVGGVATLPQYRRRGGIRGCFEQALPWMHENGYDFSYLYPFSTAYYRKFGYECCVRKLAVTLNLGLLRPEPVAGTCILADSRRPMTEAIRTVDQALEQRYNMMIRHDAAFYDWTAHHDPAGSLEFTYVWLNAEHIPKAYTTFHQEAQPDGRNLICTRFCFVDREGFQGLMGLLKSLGTDHMYAKFFLPAECSLEYLFPEWSLGAFQASLCNAGMVRVINAESVLRKAAYRGSGQVVLEIRDPQIGANSGRFRVCFENGAAVCVVRTEDIPDAILTIPAFSALMAGVSDLRDAEAWMPGLEICNAAAPLSGVFYRKPMMICDSF